MWQKMIRSGNRPMAETGNWERGCVNWLQYKDSEHYNLTALRAVLANTEPDSKPAETEESTSLNPEEIERLEEMVYLAALAIDKNKNGTLSTAEVNNAFRPESENFCDLLLKLSMVSITHSAACSQNIIHSQCNSQHAQSICGTACLLCELVLPMPAVCAANAV